MKMQAKDSSFFRLQSRILCVRNLAYLTILIIVSAPGGIAQQQVQEAAVSQPVVQPTANAVVAANIQKPLISQTPQQKQLADDTAKLLQLANELKAELDKSSKDTLSLSVMKKAEQVEKLAHKVRDEMKASLSN